MATRTFGIGSDLPRQPTALVGRERERDALKTTLAREDVRLVTLTGPGGIGKTRLALDAASNLDPDVATRAVLVSLAAVREPGLLLPTIAQCLGIREGAGLDTRDAVAQALGETRTLLILDNLEHLLDAVPDVAWIMANCHGTTMLATSRARLQIRGEHEFVVLPLPLPDPDQPLDGANPAVALFTERAREVDPEFELTEANVPIVAEICRRLDGIPLAIELAAARIKVLPPAALLARLDRRLPLLTGGPRDLPDRLRTMRDAIAWSHDLLSPDQQALFRRLCVFTGEFSLLEAQSVVAESDESILDELADLVDASLLHQIEREGEPRFLILETLSEYGLEQLAEAGELDHYRGRHADFFMNFAEAAAPRLRGAERTTWLERLSRAHGNLRAALKWSTDHEDAHRALRLAGALWQFWWWRSHLAEGRQWLERALAFPAGDGLSVARARVLTGCGALAETQGDYAAAEEYHEQAVSAWQETGDMRGLAISMLFRWLVSFNAEDHERMTAVSTESLRLFRELDDQWGIAMSLMEQGVMAMRLHDHAGAEAVLAEGIERFESINDQWGVAICQGVLGNVATDKGDYARAAEYLAKSLTSLLILNDLWGLATVLPAAARMAGEQGEYEWALRISGAIARMHETMGAPLKVPFRGRYEQTLAEARTALGDERYEAAMAAGYAMSPELAVEEALRQPAAQPSAAAIETARSPAVAFPLSPREREVLRLVPERTAREIGEELFISESTVRTHIENILNKLGLRNQKELIAYAYQHGLI